MVETSSIPAIFLFLVAVLQLVKAPQARDVAAHVHAVPDLPGALVLELIEVLRHVALHATVPLRLPGVFLHSPLAAAGPNSSISMEVQGSS